MLLKFVNKFCYLGWRWHMLYWMRKWEQRHKQSFSGSNVDEPVCAAQNHKHLKKDYFHRCKTGLLADINEGCYENIVLIQIELTVWQRKHKLIVKMKRYDYWKKRKKNVWKFSKPKLVRANRLLQSKKVNELLWKRWSEICLWMCTYVNFKDLHASVHSLSPEGEKYSDRLDWYDTEVQRFVDFQKELDLWMDNKSSSNSKSMKNMFKQM